MGIFRRNQETGQETGNQLSNHQTNKKQSVANTTTNQKTNSSHSRFQKATNQTGTPNVKTDLKNNNSRKTSVFTDSTREYGVKQIIDLLRHIPAEQDLIFGAEMIKRTLSSMKISIFDILDDAVAKEQSAEGTIHRLEVEITDYMSRIEQLKSQIQHLNSELDDIRDAKNNLTANDPKLQKHIDITYPSQDAEKYSNEAPNSHQETKPSDHDNILFDDENGLDSSTQENTATNKESKNQAIPSTSSPEATDNQIDTSLMNDRDHSDELETSIDAIFDDEIEEEGALEDQDEDESNIVFARPKTNSNN